MIRYRLITTVLRWPTEMSLDAILAAFAVSVTVGVIFGYYPAWKASRLWSRIIREAVASSTWPDRSWI